MSHEFIERNRSNLRKLSLLLNNIKIKVVYVCYNCYVAILAIFVDLERPSEPACDKFCRNRLECDGRVAWVESVGRNGI